MSDQNHASVSGSADNNQDAAPEPDRPVPTDRAPSRTSSPNNDAGNATKSNTEVINSLSTEGAEPILRGAKRIEDLQLKQLQLQFDLKAVRDELKASGKARDVNKDDVSSDEDIEASGGPGPLWATRHGPNNPHAGRTPPVEESNANIAASRSTYLNTADEAELARIRNLNEILEQENIRLRQKEESSHADHEAELVRLTELKDSLEKENSVLREQEASSSQINADLSSEITALRIQLGTAISTIESLKQNKSDENLAPSAPSASAAAAASAPRDAPMQNYEEISKLKAIQDSLLAENKKLKREIRQSGFKRGFGDVNQLYPELRDSFISKVREANIQRANTLQMLNEQVARNDKVQASLKKSEARVEALQSENASMGKFIRTKVAELGNLYNDFQAADTERKKLSEMKSCCDAEILRLKLDVENLDQDLASEKRARTELKEVNKQLENRIQQQQAEYDELLKKLNESESNLKEAREELVRKSSGNAKLRSQLSERQKTCDDLNNKLETSSRENSDAQREIDKVRRSLQEKEFDVSRLHSQIENFENNNKKLKTELDQKIREMNLLDQNMSSQISDCRTQIESLNRKLQDEKTSHETLLTEFQQLKSVELVDLRRRSKEELEKLRTQNSMREAELKSKIARLEHSLLDLQAENLDIQSERDTVLARERKDQTQISQLQAACASLTDQCNEARNLLREAQRDASEMRANFENSRRKEEALAEKQRQLEQTVSKQAIKIQELSRDDIETLKRQVQDSQTLSQQLYNLRTEYAQNASQWIAEQSSLLQQIQGQTEQCAKLEQELATLRGPENDRLSTFKSNVHTVYQIEVDRLNKDYTSAVEFIKKSMANAEEERNEAQQKWLEMQQQVQDLKFRLDQSARTQAGLEKALNERGVEVHKLEEERLRLEEERSELQSHFAKLQLELQEAKEVAQNMHNLAAEKQRELDEFITKYDDSQLRLVTTRNSYENVQRQLIECEEMRKVSLDRIYAIIKSDNHQVKALKFMKRFYAEVFPRADLRPPYNDTLRQPRKGFQTFRGVALSVLAVVKFKRALQLGIKRKAAESERYLKESGWTQ